MAGRAGRNDSVGEVVIQTGYPDDPAIAASARHDYEGFYNTELPNRKELCYPPFAKLARIVVASPRADDAEASIGKIAAGIRANAPSIALLGPAPAALEKMGNEFRFSLLLKAASPKLLSGVLASVRGNHERSKEKNKLIIDVDPIYMM